MLNLVTENVNDLDIAEDHGYKWNQILYDEDNNADNSLRSFTRPDGQRMALVTNDIALENLPGKVENESNGPRKHHAAVDAEFRYFHLTKKRIMKKNP